MCFSSSLTESQPLGALYQVSSKYRSNRANRPSIFGFPRVFALSCNDQSALRYPDIQAPNTAFGTAVSK